MHILITPLAIENAEKKEIWKGNIGNTQ